MTYSTIQLSEFERDAIRSDNPQIAAIIGQLIETRAALEKLTEAADSFATITEREAKNAPEFLESGYTIINTDSAEFTDLVNAITDAQNAIED